MIGPGPGRLPWGATYPALKGEIMIGKSARVAMTAGMLVLMGSALGARAGMITYTESIIGSGNYNGTDFIDRLITLTATSDTADVQQVFPGLYVTDRPGASASFSIEGIGGGTFPGYVFLNRIIPTPTFGFENDLGNGLFFDVLNITSPLLASYDLSSSIGPISGPQSSGDPTGFKLETSAGDLLIVLSVSGEVTFQAVARATAVPEPSSLVLCGIAVMGLGYAGARRRIS